MKDPRARFNGEADAGEGKPRGKGRRISAERGKAVCQRSADSAKTIAVRAVQPEKNVPMELDGQANLAMRRVLARFASFFNSWPWPALLLG